MMLAKQLEQIVNRRPDAIAIRTLSEDISYSQLWNRVQAAASAITKISGGCQYIGVVADQDARAVIASAATILSGKTVIPIDPRYDVELIKKMLQPFTDILVNGTDKEFTPGLTTISLDKAAPEIGETYAFEDTNTDAYILHTSGTTGKPKPVLADQAALMHVALELAKRYHINSEAKVLQFAYLSFDSSLIETWSTLLAGGTIIIPGAYLREDMYSCLDRLLETGQINIATLPSSVASNIDSQYLRRLDTLILAGESCPTELANGLYQIIPHLINAYGPTESIICATTYEIRSASKDTVPIGTPLPGMKIIIDNPDNDGHGEMILVSSYLAKGYAGDAQRTKDKFGVNKSNERYYRSGDIGVLCDDGIYCFLGRTDNQVKIHGQRLELEGIETVVRNVAKRSDIVVVAVRDKLYCFYRSTTQPFAYDKVLNGLKSVLPIYAIPGQFIATADLPLDFNGKINRKALIERVTAQDADLPINVEQTDYADAGIINLWARTLKIAGDAITSNTGFFSIGGDSLSALKLVKAINDTYGVNLKLSDVIASPATPASMYEAVLRQSGNRL